MRNPHLLGSGLPRKRRRVLGNLWDIPALIRAPGFVSASRLFELSRDRKMVPRNCETRHPGSICSNRNASFALKICKPFLSWKRAGVSFLGMSNFLWKTPARKTRKRPASQASLCPSHSHCNWCSNLFTGIVLIDSPCLLSRIVLLPIRFAVDY